MSSWPGPRPATGRGSYDITRHVGPHVHAHAHAAITLRGFLDDIWAWGWADTPPQRLMFDTDIPRQPEPLPRALPSDIDAAVMGSVAGLGDRFARIGITILRHAGLRIGELLDLEPASTASIPWTCSQLFSGNPWVIPMTAET